jgi:predicted ATPase/DNA-binding SARP family transcriptional activator
VALLAYLAVTGKPHSRESLATLFWPEQESAKAYAYLRRTLWEVNQALGEGWLDADRETVGLMPGANLSVDVVRFRELLRKRAEAEVDAVSRLKEAVGLYQGEFLFGLALRDSPGFAEWQFSQAEDLRRCLGEALRALAQAEAERGDYESALAQARRRLALDTLNEGAQRQVMELLALHGDRNAALRQYETCVQILKAELDVAPEAATAALYQKIKSEGSTVSPAATVLPEAEMPEILRALRSARLAPKHNLPAQLTSFVGREKEIADIKGRLEPARAQPARLVTLTGSGGIGKTRLALQAAGELVPAFPDGIWFVECAPVADPALVPQTVQAVLRVRQERERPVLSVLTDYVRERTLLLILDNCEHLIDACAHLAEALLRAGLNVWILATSREALGIPGEVAVRLPSLSLPESQAAEREALVQSEAGRLFVDRARAAWPSFEVTPENAPAIIRICRRLDGIPLAIELAAARVRALGTDQIAVRLDDRFRLLTGGSRTALPRQQTLRALIDWSYNLLTEPERCLLRRLAVFAGGWTLEAAEAVCGGDLDLLNLLTQLVDKSLVVADCPPGAEPRYFLLETIRQYAREKLLDTPEGEDLRQRHLQYYTRLAEMLEPDLRGPGLIAALNRLEAEHDNLRAALEWGITAEVVTALRLGGAMWEFWNKRSYWSEGRELLSKILALPQAQAHTLAHAQALNGLAYLTYIQLGPGPSLPLLEASLSLWRELGDPSQTGYMHALRVLGDVVYQSGDKDRGRALIEESLALARASGDKVQIAWSLFNQGLMFHGDGQMDAAQAVYAESLALHQQAQLPAGAAYLLNALGSHALGRADWDAFQPLIGESLRLFRDLGDKAGLASALHLVGLAQWMRGQRDHGILYLTESLELSREIKAPYRIAGALLGLGWLSVQSGYLDRARQHFLQYLNLAREQDWPVALVYSLVGFAALADAQRQSARAARLFGAAETHRAKLNLAWDAFLLPEVQRLEAGLRETLEPAAFAQAWAAGEQMTLEAAVGHALQPGG